MVEARVYQIADDNGKSGMVSTSSFRGDFRRCEETLAGVLIGRPGVSPGTLIGH
jgi:hypothetical protein